MAKHPDDSNRPSDPPAPKDKSKTPPEAAEPFVDFNVGEHPHESGADDDIILLGPESEPAMDFEALDAAPLNVDIGSHEHPAEEHAIVPAAAEAGQVDELVDIDWSEVAEEAKGPEPSGAAIHEAVPAEAEPVLEATQALPASDLVDFEWPSPEEEATGQETPIAAVHGAIPVEPEPILEAAEADPASDILDFEWPPSADEAKSQETPSGPIHEALLAEPEPMPIPEPVQEAAPPPAAPVPVAKPAAPALSHPGSVPFAKKVAHPKPSMLSAGMEAAPAIKATPLTPTPTPTQGKAPRTRPETMLATPQEMADATAKEGAEVSAELTNKATHLARRSKPETMLAPPGFEQEGAAAPASVEPVQARGAKATSMGHRGKPETMLAPPGEAEALAHTPVEAGSATTAEGKPEEPVDLVEGVADDVLHAAPEPEAALADVAELVDVDEEQMAALLEEGHGEEGPASGLEVISAQEDESGVLIAESNSGVGVVAVPPGPEEVITTEDVNDEDIEALLHTPASAAGDEMSSGSLASALLDEEVVTAEVEEGSSSGVDLDSKQEMDLASLEAAAEAAAEQKASEALSDEATEEEAAAALAEEPLEETVALEEGQSALDVGASEDDGAMGLFGGEQPAEVEEEVALAEEEAEEAEEAEKEKPARKPRRAAAWLGGSVLGILLGAAACVGLWVYGYEPPATWKTSILGLLGIKNTAGTPTGTAPTIKDANTFLADGRFDEGLQASEKVANKTPDVLAARGQARFLSYLQQQKKNQAAVKVGDVPLEEAKKDLTSAAKDKNPDGVFWLGELQEATGDLTEAKKTYENGVVTFKDNPAEARRFQAALDRIDSRPEPVKPAADQPKNDKPPMPAPAPGPVGLNDYTFPAAGLGLFLPVLAADVPAADKSDANEAGYDFWKALKLAKDQKYDEAIKALQSARAVHDQQRFLRLRKSQNPNSDPTEEIFLRSCDELQAYFLIRSKLGSEGYLAKQPDPVKALDDLVADKKNGQGGQIVIDKLKKDKDAAAADPDIKDVAKAIDAVLDAKNKAEEQLTAVKTALTDAKAVGADDKDMLPGLKKLIQDKKDAGDAAAAVQDLLKAAKYVTDADPNVAKGVEKLLGDKKASDDKLQAATTTLTEVNNKLTEAKFLAPGADAAALLQGVDRVVQESSTPITTAMARITNTFSTMGGNAANDLSQAFDLTSRLTATEARIAGYQALLTQSRTPRQMLDVWVALFQGPPNKDLADKASLDAQRVAGGQGDDPEERAEAQCVAGLALRTQGKFAEARQALEQAVAFAGPPKKGAWQAAARQALRDLSEPLAFYLPRAEELWAAGQLDAALSLLATGLEVFPADTKAGGQLLAMSSLLMLEKARTEAHGKAVKREALAAAEKVADAAVAAGALAEGYYAAGRIAEELRDWQKAQAKYRQALDAPQLNERSRNRSRLALARVLLKTSEGRPESAPAPARGPAGTGQRPGQPRLDPSVRQEQASNPLATMLVVLLVGAADDGLAAPLTPALTEARQLAEQAIKAGDPEGHLILAQILARQGRWTDALMEYVDGLPPAYAPGLRLILSGHPVFRMPDTLNPPDPLRAEKHFSDGLHYYWARNYPAAERSFKEAIRFYDGDARYQYFLGLVWLQQGKRPEAIEAFRRGGVLEKQSKPSTTEVNASLERVQGGVRGILNAESRR